MHISKISFILSLILVSFTSCVTDLPIDESGAGIPVVNCVLKNDTAQTLSLSRTVNISSTYSFKEISNAEIELYDGDSLVGNFEKTSYNHWELKYTPVVNDTYRLVVKLLDDSTILTATTTMPARNYIIKNEDADVYPSKNFYQFSADLPCWAFVIKSEKLLIDSSTPESDDYLQDEIGTDHPLVDQFNMEQSSLTDFLPSADTPAYFAYIRIKSDTTQNYKLNGIEFKIQTNYTYHNLIGFRTCSVEYDKYLKTSFQKVLMRFDPEDPGIWFDKTEVYSNVSNGVGIFGAYNEKFYNYNVNIDD